ncbi:MAG: hypothetical protein CMH53_05720, partial [Myxococcales bacterium]|nr:hypothetical protein [Myxococcales bacterium]
MFTAQLSDIPTAHVEHTATKLADGSVLVTGGCGADSEAQDLCVRYHEGAWKILAPLSAASRRHTATLLNTGEVLVVGVGYGRGGAALYDVGADSWYPIASPETPRVEHAAVLLDDGRVVIVGGREAELLDGIEPSQRRQVPPLATTEIFDPATSSWSEGPSLSDARRKHGLFKLADGSVLAVGGKGVTKLGGKTRIKTAERLDVQSNQWRSVGKIDPSDKQFAPLSDGRLLSCRGHIYDPSDDSWSEVEPGFRGGGPMLALADGRVACFGSRGDEVYDPATNEWTPCREPLRLHRRGHLAIALSDEQILLIGGTPGRGRGLPLAQQLWVDLEPDALIPPEASLEATG